MRAVKKGLSVFLVCVMMLCSAPLAGFVGFELPEIDFGKIFDVKAGAAEIIDSGSCGENLTYILDSDGILTISGTGNMYDYYSTTAPWCSNCESIKDVIITEGVTSIGDSAFYDCTSLTSVVIPVSIMHIEYDAFYNCTSLNSVFITDLTSWCTIDFKTPESSPLYYAEHLYINNKIATELIIPDSVSSIDNYAFSNSNAFSAVSISETISYIGSIFSSCSSLTEITILNPICGITKIAPQTVIKGYDNSTAQEYANKYDHTFESLGNAPLKTLYSGTLGDNLSWTITNHRELIIGGTGKMIDNIYGEENNPWYPYKSLIKSVIIQHGVENIGDCAFLNLDQITSVVFSDTVKYIGNSAFSGCSNLKTITIPGNVTEIRGLAFSGCTSLTDVILETGVESIQEASFSGCSSLQSIAIPDTVTSIWEAAFDGCESLTSVTIPTGVVSIAGASFRSCTSLTSVTIPNSISNIGPDAFYNCSSLTDVYYAGTEEEWDAIEIGNRNEPLLNANIHIYNVIASPPTCTTQGFTTYICSACDDTYIADFVPALGHDYSSDVIAPSCTEQGYTYYTCTVCGDAYADDYVPAVHSYVDGFCSLCGATEIIAAGNCGANLTWTLDIHGTLTISGVGGLDIYSMSEQPWCLNRNTIKKVVIEDGITNISSHAFSSCTSLVEITILSLDCRIYDNQYTFPAAAVILAHDNSTAQAYAEKYGSGFVSLDGDATDVIFSGYAGDNAEFTITRDGKMAITGSGKMYNYSNSERPWNKYRQFVKMVSIADTITSIGKYAFYDFRQLSEITIPDSVKNVGSYAFEDCLNLERVIFGENSQLINIGYYAFSSCNSLVDIIIPNNVTSIEDSAFEDCTSLTSVTFGENSQLTSIGYYAFNNCSSLVNFTIPISVTSIGYAAFSSCVSLVSIIIPRSVASIGYYAFEDCTSLMSIDILNPKCTISNSADTISNTAVIHGYDNSTAKSYARKYNRTFEAFNCEHKETEAIPAVFATCTSTGLSAGSKCALCQTVLQQPEITPVLAHAHVATVTTPATHFQTGIRTFTCVCGDTYTEVIEKISDHAYEINTIEPTCELDGYTFYYCNCGDNYTGDYVTALGHAYVGTVTTNPTCTTTGVKTYVCTNDTSHTYTEVITALGHTSGTAATCTTDQSCIVCDEVLNEKFGHDYNAVVTTPTCVEAGFTTQICAHCGDSYITDAVAPLGHTPGAVATCTDNQVCTVCGEILTEKLGHDYNAVVTEPTCSEQGYTTYTCSICGYCYIDDYTDVAHSYVNGYCSSCGDIEVIASGICGNNIKWVLDIFGTLSIFGAGIMTNYSYAETPWYPYRTSIKQVVIGNGVTNIGEWAFHYCTSITSVTIPNSVVSIEKCAFYKCTSLTTITLPETLLSLGDSVFEDCSSLAEITIPNGITSLNWYAFESCTSLTSIIIPDSVTYIGDYVFYNCTSLVDITISKAVTSIGMGAFGSCTSIQEFEIPDTVTRILMFAFSGCVSLTSITLPQSLALIGNQAFDNCISLTDITILNPECEIVDYEGTIPETAIIHGYENSTAATYAQKYNRSFVIISETNGDEFTESEDAVITDDGNICANIGKTAEALLAQASDGATLVDKDGNALSADDAIGTGAVLTLSDGTEYEIIVPGDTNGDAQITAADARFALRYSVGLETLPADSVFVLAADVDTNAGIAASDARSILRASVGLDNPDAWFEKIA